jgi:hypothetical protein
MKTRLPSLPIPEQTSISEGFVAKQLQMLKGHDKL